MTSLDNREVATDPETGWPFYALHVVGSSIVKEFFLVANYRQCIKHSKNYYEVTKRGVELAEKARGNIPFREQILAGAREINDWVAKMEAEQYHQLYVNSFIGMWSSFEAGMENVVADFLEHDKDVARSVSSLKKAPFLFEEWPWSKEECLVFAQNLERRANRSTSAPWWDVYSRLKALFKFINIDLCLADQLALDLAEANTIRNVLLHRYGQIGQREVEAFPALVQWSGKVVPFDKERFTRYYKAIVGVVEGLLMPIVHKYGRGDA